MSQDLRRERAGAQFETIAGATNYIAQLEKYRNGEPVFHVIPRDEEMDVLTIENTRLRNALAYVLQYSSLDVDVEAVVRSALGVRDE